MGEAVPPLCASSRSMFLRTWAVSCQSLKAMVSSFKKFRWAVPSAHAVSLVVRNDLWWFLLSCVPWTCMSLALVKLTVDPLVYKILQDLDMILMFGGCLTHSAVLNSVIYWYRDMPFRLMGAKAKFMIEVIPMITAAALHQLLELNYGYLALLLGFTTYFYTFAHFMHVAYDVGGIDVLLGSVMLVLGYVLNVEFLVRALALSFCLGFSFYRYVTYCAPEVPAHSKKELERLPC